jgi:chemotaxis protein methyltransferase CheR
VESLPPGWLRAYFLRGDGHWKGWYRVKPEIARLIEFRRVNLIEPSSHPELFRVIFCRNVMIYFDKPTQQKLVERLAAHLEPGGYLFIGHSESLTGIEHPLAYVRPTIYRRGER